MSRDSYHVEVDRGTVLDGLNSQPAYHVCDQRGRTVQVIRSGKMGNGFRANGSWSFLRDRIDFRYFPGERLAEVTAEMLTARGARTYQGTTGHFAVLP